MAFESIDFISAREESGSAQFRLRFTSERSGKALLRVCGLGYGYCWLNGKQVAPDLFTAPVSDYRRTLWYSEYDVTPLMAEGENVLAVWLGNGFFNESFDSAWGHNRAPWRESNRFLLELTVEGQLVAGSDGNWRSHAHTAVVSNELRSGETFDFNQFDRNWTQLEFDDQAWSGVIRRKKERTVALRRCECQPVREIISLKPLSVTPSDDGYLLDFGRNIAGYVRLRFREPCGRKIVIRHAESVEDGKLRLNGLNIYYPTVPFQTDIVIADGEEHVYSPMFTYHGFRYVELSGLTERNWECEGIEVHQCIERIADFSCSDSILNRLYAAAVNSSLNNFHYAITDCPTREKLGWGNDAAASLRQFLINFDILPLLRKWYVDIVDTQRADGAVAAIAPSPDWGYEFGAVTDIYLFAIPTAMYEYFGDDSLLKKYSANLVAYYDFYFPKIAGETPVFPLGDWDGARNHPTDLKFIELAYALIMQGYFETVSRVVPGFDFTRFAADRAVTRKRLSRYFTVDGRCRIPTVTAISMAVCLGLGNRDALRAQLLEIIEKQNGDIDCGMVGTQFFFRMTGALGLTGLALQVLTRDGSCYRRMIEAGDTLWETCDETAATVSHNHHMYSNFVEIFFLDVLGIRENGNAITVEPAFDCGLAFVRGYRTIRGKRVSVEYRVNGSAVELHVICPEDGFAHFRGKPLRRGQNKFLLQMGEQCFGKNSADL